MIKNEIELHEICHAEDIAESKRCVSASGSNELLCFYLRLIYENYI